MNDFNSVKAIPTDLVLTRGTTFTGTHAEVFPSDAENKELSWSSSDTSIAEVSSTGVITAKNLGRAVITATNPYSKSYAEINVFIESNVYSPLMTKVTFAKSLVSMNVGNTYTMVSAVTPSNAGYKSLSWYSSNHEVLTVDNNGKFTAQGEGTAKVMACARDGSGVFACCNVRVTGFTSVKTIEVIPSKKAMLVGESAFLNTSISPSNATNTNVQWSSDNTTVATVNPTSGLIYAQNPGTTTIRATAQDGSGVVGTCNVTVDDLTIPGLKTIARCRVRKDTSMDDTAILTDSNGNNVVLEIGETVPLLSDTKIIDNDRYWYRILYNGMIMHVTADDNSFEEIDVSIPETPDGECVCINTGDGTPLRLRSVPNASNDSTIIGRFTNGANVVITNEIPQNSIWYAVYGQLNNGTCSYGWCSGEYLGNYVEYGTLVDVDTLTVRSGPGTSYTKLGTIIKGDSVEVLEKNCATGSGYTWHKIRYNESEGYVIAGNNTPNFTFETRWVAIVHNSSSEDSGSDGFVGDYKDFLDILGYYESSNRYNIEKGSYLGKYMMGPLALQEAGFQDENGNWTKLASTYGVSSKEDFLNNSKAQDVAVELCHKKIWTYLDDFSMEKLGQTYQNVIITESGLLAGAHLVGAFDLMTAIEDKVVIKDGNNMPAHKYMEEMSNYNISQIK